MSGVLVLLEHTGGEIDRLSREALAFGGPLTVATGGELEAVAIGPDAAATVGSLAGSGVQTAHLVRDERLDSYAPAAWAAAIVELIETRKPAAVIAGGSDRGNEVLAHVAARLQRPMAANVVTATPGKPWRLTRQRWAGSLLEDAELDADVHLLTIAPHVVAVDEASGGTAAASASAPPTTLDHHPAIEDRDLVVRVTGREAPAAGSVSLTDARVVVGGGRGVGSAEAFATLEELASLVGGAVGGSRVVTSNGWRPHSDQIGQTGLRIAPDLYIACGISGAIQHIVGCKAAKRILAINTDADSPVMGVADYAVIGDLHQVVPAISAEIRRRSGTG